VRYKNTPPLGKGRGVLHLPAIRCNLELILRLSANTQYFEAMKGIIPDLPEILYLMPT
jgi:hypothetical protein